MLSFGIELSRAFWMAAARVALAVGIRPALRAATMIARESFEKSWPRLASAAPFLCLIDDHLLCPDMRLLSHQVEEALVDPRVVRQLGVERGDEEAPLAQQHGLAVERRRAPRRRRRSSTTRGARMKTPRSGSLLAGELEVGLEARHLAAVAVPRDASTSTQARGGSRSSRIIPAHVPKTGRAKRRIASSSP